MPGVTCSFVCVLGGESMFIGLQSPPVGRHSPAPPYPHPGPPATFASSGYFEHWLHLDLGNDG